MDLIVVAAEADAAFASELEHAFGRADLFKGVRSARIADDAELDALILKETRQRDVLAVVVVSRAFAAGIRSLVRFDDVLGTRVDGRWASVAVVRAGEAAPSVDVKTICERRGALVERSTAEDVARQLVGRITPPQDEPWPASATDRWNDRAPVLRNLNWILRIIWAFGACLFFLLKKCS